MHEWKRLEMSDAHRPNATILPLVVLSEPPSAPSMFADYIRSLCSLQCAYVLVGHFVPLVSRA